MRNRNRPRWPQSYSVAKVGSGRDRTGQDIQPTDPFRPPLTVLSFDIENAIKERTIFTICGVTHRSDGQRTTFRLRDKAESEMLRAFANAIRAEDADVVTGYNIGGYDIPLVQERAEEFGVEDLPFGRDNGPFREAGERLWRLSGRVVADAWWAVRRDLRPKQESLQFVSRTFLGDQKLDVDRGTSRPSGRRIRNKVVEYCEHDADLALRILEKLRTVGRRGRLGDRRAPSPRGRTQRPDLPVHRRDADPARRPAHIGVPMNHHARRENPIEGGYVHTIKPGI